MYIHSYLFFPSCLRVVPFQKKEKTESERLLMDQLQAKELELLQLKTEMETSQGPEQGTGLLNFYIIILISSYDNDLNKAFRFFFKCKETQGTTSVCFSHCS